MRAGVLQLHSRRATHASQGRIGLSVPEHETKNNNTHPVQARDRNGLSKEQVLIVVLLATAAGFLLGVVTITADCDNAAWWNPVALYRVVTSASSNPLLAITAPQVTESLKYAGGALVTAGIGWAGVGGELLGIPNAGRTASVLERRRTMTRTGEPVIQSDLRGATPAKRFCDVSPCRNGNKISITPPKVRRGVYIFDDRVGTPKPRILDFSQLSSPSPPRRAVYDKVPPPLPQQDSGTLPSPPSPQKPLIRLQFPPGSQRQYALEDRWKRDTFGERAFRALASQ